ncbi:MULTISPECIES: polysaccharide deacetylase family protein [unclassified Ruminococcus]|uniref:polysaccharide deacetylase family protein n=1 Tax=unclassified Ruminococcus TaxID=2608920 RepID=UPI00210C6F33|nr:MULTISPECIES: polysaccharide deacetylase family protein [unclassified Ruminococcus]MCQ4022179.1 polysaccharide deacetylase family protein [Ruminococcus sp. zg-924]MCQ4115577.1 polysaccharide deacetylase family protein [Ruminococcus sp. zg-921]
MFINFKVSKNLIALVLIFTFLLLSFIAYPGAETVRTSAVNRKNSIVLPVIMYHSLLKDKRLQGNYVISPELFKSDVKFLKERGYRIIGAQELLDYTDGKLNLPEKCVMLTFDDGYYNNYLYAYQTAKEENIKFILSPIAINADTTSEKEHLSPSYSHCTWAQLKEMVDSKHVELMNHSYDMHQNLSRKGTKISSGENTDNYKTLLTEDLTKAQELFKKNVGFTPLGFAYPFGEVCDEAEQVIKKMGFKMSFSCNEKLNIIEIGNSECLYCIGRYLRTGNTTSEEFFDKILPNENK